VALGAAAGCGDGDDGPTGPNADLAGQYDVVQVNDDTTPPFTVFQGVVQGSAISVEILSASFTLDADGGYTSRATSRFTLNGRSQGDDVAPTQAGRYTVAGNTITFDPRGDEADEPSYTATRDGDALTIAQTNVNPLTGAPIAVRLVARR
jgi:hypothetical protein